MVIQTPFIDNTYIAIKNIQHEYNEILRGLHIAVIISDVNVL